MAQLRPLSFRTLPYIRVIGVRPEFAIEENVDNVLQDVKIDYRVAVEDE